MAKKETGLSVVVSPEAMERLRQDFPVEQGFTRVLLPRLGMVSQDVTEEVRDPKTKKKEIKLITEAGQFFIEKQTDEENEEGRRIWSHDEIEAPEGIILFQRKQLRMYDESTQLYTSSPVFDDEAQVLPLFCDKKEVARGTPKELKAKYEFTDKEGKTKSKLEDNRILYVLYEDTVYQMNLRGSSMYSYLTYTRDLNKKGIVPPAVVTQFGSEAKSKGTIDWNMMTFTASRGCTKAEIADVQERMTDIKSGIAQERSFFAAKDIQQGEDESDEDFAARKETLKNF